MAGGNVFAVLMDAARVCSLQQITEAFFEVGGQYRRSVWSDLPFVSRRSSSTARRSST